MKEERLEADLRRLAGVTVVQDEERVHRVRAEYLAGIKKRRFFLRYDLLLSVLAVIMLVLVLGALHLWSDGLGAQLARARREAGFALALPSWLPDGFRTVSAVGEKGEFGVVRVVFAQGNRRIDFVQTEAPLRIQVSKPGFWVYSLGETNISVESYDLTSSELKAVLRSVDNGDDVKVLVGMGRAGQDRDFIDILYELKEFSGDREHELAADLAGIDQVVVNLAQGSLHLKVVMITENGRLTLVDRMIYGPESFGLAVDYLPWTEPVDIRVSLVGQGAKGTVGLVFPMK